MKISIFGLGYVGTVSFGCLVRDGHHVIGVDIDQSKLDLIERGVSPIVEEGIPELIADAMKSGRGQVTDSAVRAIADSDISFVCVGTPSQRDGRHNLEALSKVCREIGEAIKKKQQRHTVVIRSTVPPGTTEGLVKQLLENASGALSDVDFDLCFHPEFLREGASIKDYDNPPFTVVAGTENGVDRLRDLFGKLPGEFVVVPMQTAEMVKFCCNAFHALKITFANEVGRICAGLGIDSRTVMDLICLDKQLNISTVYMKPGFAFGGSCLPKDLRAITSLGVDNGVKTPMIASINESNKEHIRHAVELALNLDVRRVGLLGLSFKDGTDDLRESPLLDLAERLSGKGVKLKIYDANVSLSTIMGANRRFVMDVIPHISTLIVEKPEQILEDVDAIIVGARDDNFVDAWIESRKYDLPVLDFVGIEELEKSAKNYHGICW